MVNKVVVSNDHELIVVSSGKDDKNHIKFISDLEENLSNFILDDVNASSVTFSSDKIGINNEVERCRYRIYFSDNVLIRNKNIVINDCTPLINNNIIILK